MEKESVHSVEGSVTDSGRGPSEEGEAGHVRHNRERCIPPPPPPPRGAYWLQPLKSSDCATGGQTHPTVRFHGLVPTPEERTTSLLPSEARSPPLSVGVLGHSRTLPYRKQPPHSLLKDTTASSPSSSELGLYIDRLLSNSYLNSAGRDQQQRSTTDFMMKSEAPTRTSVGEQTMKRQVQQLGASSASDDRCNNSRQLLQHQQPVGHGGHTMRKHKTYDCAYDRLVPTNIPLISSSSASVSAAGLAGPDVIV